LARPIGSASPGLVDLESASSEPFRNLRLAIELRPQPSTSNAVLFTSPAVGDGKSVTAANYALVAAQGQLRVLLIDADMRRPTVHRTFGLQRVPGLSELLRDGRELEDVRQPAPFAESLDVMPAGTPITRSGDFLESLPAARMLDRARADYDLVVIDSPPVVGLADALSLASQPGIEVVVVTDAKGRRRQLQKALRALEYAGATVLGVVVNRVGDLDPYEYEP
jgi:capsular exopolysaccharide synthesis family protein